MRSGARLVCLVAVTALVATACSGDDDGAVSATTARATSTSSTTTSTSAAPTTTAAPVAPIAWRGCGNGTECASLRVPVDHAAPGGPAIDIAVARLPATDPANRIGSLVVNPGGPGVASIRSLGSMARTLGSEVRRRFDIVTFDPRGVGDSTRLGCGGAVAPYRALDLEPDDGQELQAMVAGARAVADECARADAGLLANLGTRQTVEDLEQLRAALGEERITFVGFSYGTFIGQLWADAHPSSVRALVLDGVVDPADDPLTASKRVVAGLEATIGAIDADCAQRPSCPIDDVGATYDRVEAALEQRPLGRAGPSALAYATVMATYDPSYWPVLTDALAAAERGDGRGITSLADRFTTLADYVAFAVTGCDDAPHPVGEDEWAGYAAALAAISPRVGATIANDGLPCAFWPQSTLVPRRVRAEGTPPILVIGATGDAATPYSQSVAVADALADGHLLTVERTGHTSLGDSGCADRIAARYLIDLAVPADGARC